MANTIFISIYSEKGLLVPSFSRAAAQRGMGSIRFDLKDSHERTLEKIVPYLKESDMATIRFRDGSFANVSLKPTELTA